MSTGLDGALQLSSTGVSLRHLEDTLHGEAISPETARQIIQENTTDGGLLRRAAEEGLLNVIQFFFGARYKYELTPDEQTKCTNTGAVDRKGNTPLHLAAANGHISIVQYIISSGARADIPNRYSETSLYLACCEGHENIVRFLIESGARLDPFSYKDRRTPIDIAASKGHVTVVKLLLDSGAERHNALFFAAEACRENIVALLLQHFAPTGLLNEDHWALHQAAEKGHVRICEMLVDAGADLSRIDTKYCCTPIQLAAKHGHIAIVQFLLLRGASTKPVSKQSHSPLKWDFPDRPYKTPLDYAVENGHIAIAYLLLSHGCALNKTLILKKMIEKDRFLAVCALLAMGEDMHPIERKVALHIACAANNLKMVEFLLMRKAIVSARDDRLNTPLHVVCKNSGSESIVKTLLDHGAEIDAINENGSTPLLLTTTFRLQKFLLESGADPHIIDKWSTTALHRAANVEIVKLLLERNVLVDARGQHGMTPLMKASYLGRTDIAEILLQYGASVSTVSRYGVTPLGLAVSRGKHDIVDVLLRNGADVNTKCNNQHETALHLACKNDDSRCSVLLLKWEAKVDARNKEGDTPLHLAAQSGAVEIIQLLAAHGACINAVNKVGQTPLHFLRFFRCERIARLLLQNGANALIEDSKGQTPLLMAQKLGLTEVVSAFQEHLSQRT